MKYAQFSAVILCLFIVGWASSCKKKGVTPVSVKIAAIDMIHLQSIIHYRVVYDAVNGNVDSIINVGGGTDTGYNGFRKFDYHTTSYMVTDQNNHYYNVWINSDGSIIEILTTDTLLMKYNGTQLFELDVKSPSINYPYYTFTKTNYYWQSGDITILVTSTANDTIDYDNGRSGQQGDAMRIDQFLAYGQSYTKTTHLPKDKKSNGQWIERYFYEFDGSNRATQFMKVQNNYGSAPDDTVIYNYRY
jgi:hypothetical protein